MNRAASRERINQGVLLVLAGLYFLLRNLGVVDVSFWNTAVDHWPILLIFAGVYVMFSRSILWFVPATLSVILFLMFAGFLPGVVGTNLPARMTTFEYPIGDGISRVDVILDAPVAEVSLARGSGRFVSGTVEYRRTPPSATGRQVGDRFIIDLDYTPSRRSRLTERLYAPFWDVSLLPDVPLFVTARTAVSTLSFDFEGLDVREVDIETSVGTVDIAIDESVTTARLKIDSAVSFVGISVPTGVGVRAKVNGALVWNNLKRHGFQRHGDVYVSPEYDTASRRVEIEISTAVGMFVLRRDDSETASDIELED